MNKSLDQVKQVDKSGTISAEKSLDPASKHHTTEVVEVEEEYYDEEEGSLHSEEANLELKRLQEMVQDNKDIPEVIILKDEFGVPHEYEVLVESEEFDTSYLGSS